MSANKRRCSLKKQEERNSITEMDRKGERHAMAKNEQIEKAFTYHAPKEGQPERYQAIRDIIKAASLAVDIYSPNSREKSLALTKLEEAVMWANAAIARNE